MIEVDDGIYWLKLPMAMDEANEDHVNIYLIRGEKGNLLVDAGWNTDKSLSILREELATKGIDLGDISQIVVTHIHPDHYGMAGRLKQLSGATLASHHSDSVIVQNSSISANEKPKGIPVPGKDIPDNLSVGPLGGSCHDSNIVATSGHMRDTRRRGASPATGQAFSIGSGRRR